MQKADSFKETSKYSFWQLIKDTFRLIKPYRRRFWLATLLRIISDLAYLYPAFAIASIINFLTEYQDGDSLKEVWVIIALFFVAITIKCVFQYLAKLMGFQISEKIQIDSNLQAISHLFRLDMNWHERENSGNKIKRIHTAGAGFTQIVRLWYVNIIQIVVNLIAINIIIAQFDHTVLKILIVFFITFFAISFFMERRGRNAAHQVNVKGEEFNGLIYESVSNIRTVKAMSMTKTISKNLSQQAAELFRRISKRIFIYQSRSGILNYWDGLFRVVLIVVIIHGIVDGRYEVGFLVLVYSYFSNLSSSINELATTSVEFVISKLSIGRLKIMLDEPANIENDEGKVDFAKDWKKIKFTNVSFSYEENKVLQNISFEVNKGEKIGIVGLSGAGKSTLFKLLLKEREEFEGDICFDDISIKRIKKDSYFERVAVVLQDTEVFNFPLVDNITITNMKEDSNQRLLNQALNTSHLSELVKKLPLGLNTLIGEKGVKLSGGERQRLGIARAIFKEPEILLLDEATSHLDLESEEKIRDSLHKFFEKVTAIVIAHRLTTIKEMDKILVIEQGKILESGSFQELYAKKGRFYDLWEKQKL